MCEWIVAELAGINLEDQRLNQRVGQLLERLAANPAASVNAACQGWSETQAAYRFFDNARVEPQKLLQPHRQATQRRIAKQPVALIVQDTTELDYTVHPAEAIGLLNTADRYGFYDHTHAAFTPEGLCLGVLDVELFNRTADTLGKAQERKRDPIETKESYRWLRGYRLACEVSAQSPETQVISVADCEGDIYDIFLDAQQQSTPAEFVIRAKIDRSLPERDTAAGAHAYRKVWDEVADSEPIATRELQLPRTPQRDAREVTLVVRAQRQTIKPPHTRARESHVTLGFVLVEEVDPPNDGTAVQWKLITSLPVDSAEAAWQVVDYYRGRWGIEVFFRVFKTGCRVEEIQLETTARLQNCLMLYKIVAWRVMYLTYLGRECPELPCSVVFAEIEWKPTWQIATGESPPAEPPTLDQFLRVLAKLGGYNDRKQDAPPGPQAVWVGVRRMTDFAIAWTSLQKAEKLVCN